MLEYAQTSERVHSYLDFSAAYIVFSVSNNASKNIVNKNDCSRKPIRQTSLELTHLRCHVNIFFPHNAAGNNLKKCAIKHKGYRSTVLAGRSMRLTGHAKYYSNLLVYSDLHKQRQLMNTYEESVMRLYVEQLWK